jgi:hypothetical protein
MKPEQIERRSWWLGWTFGILPGLFYFSHAPWWMAIPALVMAGIALRYISRDGAKK